MTDPTPEELKIRADHKQELARIEAERDLELAQLDAQAFGRAPMALRMLFDDRLAVKVERVAERMSKAIGFTPPHLLGKTEACIVVVTRAVTWNLDPFQVAMATYQTPDGKVGIEGSLARAILEASGELKGVIRHEWYGEWDRLPRPSFKMVEKRRNDGRSYKVPEPAWEYWGAIEHGLGVRITATLGSTGEEMSLDFDLVDAYPRNATTWPTRPKLQILNPAIRAFAKMVRPSLLLGVHSPDDQGEETDGQPRDVTPRVSIPYADPMDQVVAEQLGGGNGGQPPKPSGQPPRPPEPTPSPPMPPGPPTGNPLTRRPGRPKKPETIAREIIAEIMATAPEDVRDYRMERLEDILGLPQELQPEVEAAIRDREAEAFAPEPAPDSHDPETGEIREDDDRSPDDIDPLGDDAFAAWHLEMATDMAGRPREFLVAAKSLWLKNQPFGDRGADAVQGAFEAAQRP
jgi:hypothetical protein